MQLETEAGLVQRAVRVRLRDAVLAGDLALPRVMHGLVLFAHGSGSGRLSPRNRRVARALNGVGLATLLFDLLTEAEEQEDMITRELRFDIPFLARRLAEVRGWAGGQAELVDLPVGYFGASTGAAAALVAAADHPEGIGAVVSRGGRPDLAGEALERVRAPTLLIVGGRDTVVLELNREAMARMDTTVELEIVPGATHLFEEPGTLDDVSRRAGRWFLRHLGEAG